MLQNGELLQGTIGNINSLSTRAAKDKDLIYDEINQRV